jgi:hypothetical protein
MGSHREKGGDVNEGDSSPVGRKKRRTWELCCFALMPSKEKH